MRDVEADDQEQLVAFDSIRNLQVRGVTHIALNIALVALKVSVVALMC